MRWLTELLHPSEKCVRVGHRERTIKRRTYRTPNFDERRYVVMGCKEHLLKCDRCRKKLSAWVVIDREGFSSSSMPSDMHEALRRDGVVVR